jgi:hypothetical protein
MEAAGRLGRAGIDRKRNDSVVINSGILHRSFRLDDGRAGLFYGQGDLLRRRA